MAPPHRGEPLARPAPQRAAVGRSRLRRPLIAPDEGQATAGDRALLEAVARLNPQRRVVVVLRYGIGYSPAEIAALLELPVGTVHSRLARALEDLREPTAGGFDAERA